MPRTKVYFFGCCRVVSRTGVPIRVPAKKALALLLYLTARPDRPVTRAKLSELLWPETQPDQARASLRQALATLRRNLGPDRALIECDAEHVAARGAQLRTDLAEFEQCIERGEEADLERAAALYESEFLEGFSPRAASFEDWLLLERQRLHGAALNAMLDLLRRSIDRNDPQRLTVAASRLLRLDASQEAAHRALMRAYANAGHFDEALRQFERCRTMLRLELSVEPDLETVELRRTIREFRVQRAQNRWDGRSPTDPQAMMAHK